MNNEGPGPEPTGDVLIGPGGAVLDDRLVLLFTCCHPALPLAGRVALTCKTVTGMSTRQVARAFLVSEATMGQRLLRTRNKIAHAGIGFAAPPPHRLAERTSAVLAVLYLLFNEGYAASEGAAADDPDLAREAIELAVLVSRLLPDDPETHALSALLPAAARTAAGPDRPARRPGADGGAGPDPLGPALIASGLAALREARVRTGGSDRPGPYDCRPRSRLCTTTPATAADTDWPAVVGDVRRAARGAAVPGRRAEPGGRGRVSPTGRRPGWRSWRRWPPTPGWPATTIPAVRADLLRRAGRTTEAVAAYRQAMAGIDATPNGDSSQRRLDRTRRLSGPSPDSGTQRSARATGLARCGASTYATASMVGAPAREDFVNSERAAAVRSLRRGRARPSDAVRGLARPTTSRSICGSGRTTRSAQRDGDQAAVRRVRAADGRDQAALDVHRAGGQAAAGPGLLSPVRDPRRRRRRRTPGVLRPPRGRTSGRRSAPSRPRRSTRRSRSGCGGG